MADTVDAVAAHRPYGLECKCGRAINSDADWAQHLIDALGLTEETHSYQETETKAESGGEGVMAYAGQTTRVLVWVTDSRLVSPWVRKDNTNE